MTPTVLVTALEQAKGAAVFAEPSDISFQTAPADEAGLAEAVLRHGSRAVVIGAQRYEGPLYRALAGNAAIGSLQGGSAQGGSALIVRFGVGHDGVDKRLARELGITVANTPGTLDISVAEHTLWLIGCLVRHVATVHGRFVAGSWSGITGSELHGRTLGLIGCGPIARRVAAIACFGFGMRVIACGRRPRAELEAACGPIASLGIAEYAQDIDAAVQAAEIVSLHLPATPETRQLFADARFARMRPGALFINTGRGSLVDEAALHRALSAGPLAAAAIDVFEHEPYVPVDPALDLRLLPNVVLTPHVGSNTVQANRRMAAACVANVRAFFAGRSNDLTRVG